MTLRKGRELPQPQEPQNGKVAAPGRLNEGRKRRLDERSGFVVVVARTRGGGLPEGPLGTATAQGEEVEGCGGGLAKGAGEVEAFAEEVADVVGAKVALDEACGGVATWPRHPFVKSHHDSSLLFLNLPQRPMRRFRRGCDGNELIVDRNMRGGAAFKEAKLVPEIGSELIFGANFFMQPVLQKISSLVPKKMTWPVYAFCVLVLSTILYLLFSGDTLYFYSFLAEVVRASGILLLLQKIVTQKSLDGAATQALPPSSLPRALSQDPTPLRRRVRHTLLVQALLRARLFVLRRRALRHPRVRLRRRADASAEQEELQRVPRHRKGRHPRRRVRRRRDFSPPERDVKHCHQRPVTRPLELTKQILWAFSTYLESIVLFPQIWIVHQMKVVETQTSHYLVFISHLVHSQRRRLCFCPGSSRPSFGL